MNLSPNQFSQIARLARDRWGLHLTEKKISLVSSRLASFLRKSGYESVDAYLHYLEDNGSEEDMLVFFDLLSTNVTSFFRDQAHFDYLEREFYTPLARGNTTLPGRAIRIWSAGCSTGCEPYSMAINACDSLSNRSDWNISILATDLSNSAVEEARNGVYQRQQLEKVPEEIIRKYFRSVSGQKDRVQVCDEIRQMVKVAQLNLMDVWPMKGPFDVIFCRNVMIYFDTATRRDLVLRFHELLRPGGIFAVGSAETLSGLNTPFRPVQASMYKK
ncbi:MAG: protein-glutamate O-methyltransferase CheR [Phycisphaerales bacterium]|nr:MAG: protein-glutamate O-methyltransferase CheR [Phycisphaerales bacterium]